MWSPQRTFLLCATTVVVASCGGGGGGSVLPDITFRQVTQQIGPSGGEVVFPGEASIFVPPGALTKLTEVRLRISSAPLLNSPNRSEHWASIELAAPTGSFSSDCELQVAINATESDNEGTWAVAFGQGSLVGFPSGQATRLDPETVGVIVKGVELYSLPNTRGDASEGFDITFAKGTKGTRGYGVLKRSKNGAGIVVGATTLEEVPSSLGLANQKVAIIVHGLNNSAEDVIDLGFVVEQASRSSPLGSYSRIWFFNYHDNIDGIDEAGAKLAELLVQHGVEDAQFVDFFGHSMGGLVSRWAVEKEGIGAFTRRVMTFGTPHRGVPAKVMNIVRWIGDGWEDLSEDSAFMRRLNDLESPFKDRVVYCTIAGRNYNYIFKKFGIELDIGNLARAKYLSEPDPYLGDIDGIVSWDSATPNDMTRFGIWDPVRCRATLEYNHSDIGGSMSNNSINSTLRSKVDEFLTASISGGIR